MMEMIITWAAELVPLIAALTAFLYGVRKFFKKKIALYLQSITMAMGCHALGSIYRVCQTLTNESTWSGFTPAYLGHIGFFLFFIAASYGQLDRIVDDGSAEMRPCRYIALAAPIAAALLYLPNYIPQSISSGIKATYLLVWFPAGVSLYFSTKHAIIPNLDFGFVKAIKPCNVMITCLGFFELICLTARNFNSPAIELAAALVFGALCIATMLAAQKGVEKWTV